MTNASAFFDEFLGTAVLVIVVFAINDKKNNPPPGGLAPLVLFLLILGIGASIGMQTGFPCFCSIPTPVLNNTF
jgi:aquaglyceroporin related protein